MRRLLALAAALLFAAALAACGVDQRYNEQLAGEFSATKHVIVEKDASPKLPNGDTINAQALTATQQLTAQFDGSAKMQGVFVANVGSSKADAVTYDSLHDAMVQKFGSFSGVILVLSDRYHVRAFNVSKELASSVDRILANASAAHHGDLYGGTSAIVTALGKVSGTPMPSSAPQPDQAPVPPQQPVVISPAAPPAHHGPSGATVFGWIFGVLGGLGVLGAAAWGVVAVRRRRGEQDRLRSDLIQARYDLDALSNRMVYANDKTQQELSSQMTLAGSALADADTALKQKDYVAARAHLNTLDDAMGRTSVPDSESITAMGSNPKKASVRAKEGSKVVTVRNDRYRRRADSKYSHYWHGGSYNGVDFNAGYYAYPFWLYQWDSGDVNHSSTTVADSWDEWNSPPVSASYDNTPHDSSSGSSASYTPSSSHHDSSSGSSSSYSSFPSPSYDSGGSFGGFSGGGFDSGGFSGGGFDSGGSSGGF